MSWMLTHTGAAVELEWMAPDTLSILDVAHHVAQINRFSGAALRPYSVAEHSLLVAEIAERELGLRDPTALLAALLHDAHEAYVGDMSTPLKLVIGQAWTRTEARAAFAVRRRFGVDAAHALHFAHIHRADRMALATERAQLMAPSGPPWQCLHGYPAVTWVRLADRAHMSWEDWRQAFIDRFAELNYARSLVAEPVAAYEGPHA